MELKPCPFCGGEAEYEQIGTSRKSTIIVCQDCGCTLETNETFSHGSSWNNRTPDTVPRSVFNASVNAIAKKDGLLKEMAEALDSLLYRTEGIAFQEKWDAGVMILQKYHEQIGELK